MTAAFRRSLDRYNLNNLCNVWIKHISNFQPSVYIIRSNQFDICVVAVAVTCSKPFLTCYLFTYWPYLFSYICVYSLVYNLLLFLDLLVLSFSTVNHKNKVIPNFLSRKVYDEVLFLLWHLLKSFRHFRGFDFVVKSQLQLPQNFLNFSKIKNCSSPMLPFSTN